MSQALILEDEKGLHLLYKHTLQKVGFAVTFAHDDVDFVHLLQQHTPQLIFFDLSSTRQTRIQTYQTLINWSAHLPNLQIVITSSQPSHGAQIAPEFAFCLKPVRPAMIKKLAEQALMRQVLTDLPSFRAESF